MKNNNNSGASVSGFIKNTNDNVRENKGSDVSMSQFLRFESNSSGIGALGNSSIKGSIGPAPIS